MVIPIKALISRTSHIQQAPLTLIKKISEPNKLDKILVKIKFIAEPTLLHNS